MSVEASLSADAAAIGQEVVISKGDNPQMVPGRRDFMQYRELGVTAASEGRIRAQITSSTAGLSEPTGWHVHLCEGQLVYMLNGWVDLEFAGGRVERVSAGDSMYIPGDTPHNEIATSNAFELIEVSIPADMGTVVCDAPD
jgi:quercetin dioxygenase-like cupin family protein